MNRNVFITGWAVALFSSSCLPTRYQSTRLTTERYGATAIDDGDSVLAYPGVEGAAFSSTLKDGGTRARLICALPPAQGAREVENALKAALDGRAQQSFGLKAASELSAGVTVLDAGAGHVSVDDEVGLALAREVNVRAALETRRVETVQRMFEQTERTLFLQFSLYRLCEAFNNSMLTATPVALRLLQERQLVGGRMAAHESEFAAAELRRKQAGERRATSANDAEAARAAVLAANVALAACEKSKKSLGDCTALSAAVASAEADERARSVEARAAVAAASAADSAAEALGAARQVLRGQLEALDTELKDTRSWQTNTDPYGALFESILETARRLSEERPVVEANARATRAEAEWRAREADSAKARAESEVTAQKAKVSELTSKLEALEKKVAASEKTEAEAKLSAFKECLEKKSCTLKN